MEPFFFFFFKGTTLEANNKFTLDFSNSELVYQIHFSTKNDSCITTMNCNLVIANYYGDILDDIKKYSAKRWLSLEKGSSYQFDLSLLRLAFYQPGMKHEIDELYLLSYQENVDLFSWRYKFYDITDNQIKDCKMFSPYMQFKNKGFEFADVKKNIALL